MIEKSDNDQIALVVTGISSPQLILWKPLIEQLISEEMDIVYYTGSGLSEEDNRVIQNIQKESLIIKKFDSENFPPKTSWVLFCDTADSLTNLNPKDKSINWACFFGGLGKFNYQEQAINAERVKIDRLVTDILPDEIAEMSGSCPIYLLSRFVFLPPSLSLIEPIKQDQNEKVLCLTVNLKKEISNLSQKRIIHALSSMKFFRLENLASSNISNFFTELILPSENCHTVLIIGKNPSLSHVIAKICFDRGIKLITIDSSLCFSPIRSFLDNNLNSINWLDAIEPLNSISLREKIFELIKENSLFVEEQSNFHREEDSLKEDFILKDLFFDEDDQKYTAISKIYKEYFLEDFDDVTSYITHPIKYLGDRFEVQKTISFTLSLLITQKNIEFFKDETKEKLISLAIRLGSKLNHDHFKIYYMRRIFSIDHDLFYNCLKRLCSENESLIKNSAFFSVLQNIVLTTSMDDNSRTFCIKSLLEIQKHNDISLRLLLSLKDFSVFDRFLKQIPPEQLHDKVASAVYFTLQNQSLKSNQNLSRFEEYCLEAIKSGHDGIYTHRTLAIVKILKGHGRGTAQILANPIKPNCSFSQFPFFWHELSLFSIYAGDEEEAAELLNSPNNKHGGPDLTNRLGAIAINLLLGRIDQSEKFASELDLNDQEFWPAKSPPYYNALYQSIIFKHCAAEKAEKSVKKMLDLTKIQLDEAFRPLLDRISSSTNPKKHLMKLSHALTNALPQLG